MLKRLEENCERGEFYEAQFQYKSIYTRQLGQKEFVKAMDFQASGVATLLKYKQFAFAVELAGLVQELYLKSLDTPLMTKAICRLSKLFRAHNADTQRIDFLTDLLSFLAGKGKAKVDPSTTLELRAVVHYELALAHWKVKQFGRSHLHFINTDLGAVADEEDQVGEDQQHNAGAATDALSENGCPSSTSASSPPIPSTLGDSRCRAQQFGSMLCEWYVNDLMAEDTIETRFEFDLLVGRACLLLLCSSNPGRPIVVRVLCGYMPEIAANYGIPLDLTERPLFHFIRLLCTAIDKKSYTMCQKLCAVYSACLQVDPFFSEIISKIKQVHFNVQPAGGSDGGLFGLLRSLLE